eukprot:6832867-Prymnesium_polylepis.1
MPLARCASAIDASRVSWNLLKGFVTESARGGCSGVLSPCAQKSSMLRGLPFESTLRLQVACTACEERSPDDCSTHAGRVGLQANSAFAAYVGRYAWGTV